MSWPLACLSFDGFQYLMHLGLLGRIFQGSHCSEVFCTNGDVGAPLWGRSGNSRPLILGLDGLGPLSMFGGPGSFLACLWSLYPRKWSLASVFGVLFDLLVSLETSPSGSIGKASKSWCVLEGLCIFNLLHDLGWLIFILEDGIRILEYFGRISYIQILQDLGKSLSSSLEMASKWSVLDEFRTSKLYKI